MVFRRSSKNTFVRILEESKVDVGGHAGNIPGFTFFITKIARLSKL